MYSSTHTTKVIRSKQVGSCLTHLYIYLPEFSQQPNTGTKKLKPLKN